MKINTAHTPTHDELFVGANRLSYHAVPRIIPDSKFTVDGINSKTSFRCPTGF